MGRSHRVIAAVLIFNHYNHPCKDNYKEKKRKEFMYIKHATATADWKSFLVSEQMHL